MLKNDDILFQWSEPEKVFQHRYSEQKKCVKQAFLRTVIVFTIPYWIILIFSVLLLKKADLPSQKLSLLFFLFYLFLIPTIWFLLREGLVQKQKHFQIAENGIRGLRDHFFYFKWLTGKEKRGFWVSAHENYPDFLCVHFKTGSRVYQMILPEGQAAQEIIGFLKNKINQMDPPEPKEKINLKKTDYLFLFLFTLIYLIVLTGTLIFLDNLGVFNSEDFKGLFYGLFVTFYFVFGPGSLGLMILYRKRYFQHNEIKAAGFYYNMVALLVIFLVVFVFAVYLVWNMFN